MPPALVRVYNSDIQKLVKVGQVRRWGSKKAEEIAKQLMITAPKRSWKLSTNIFVKQNRDTRTEHFATGFNVTIDSSYAAFVIKGTGIYGPTKKVILPNNPSGLFGPLEAHGPYKAGTFITHNYGQKPQQATWITPVLRRAVR